MLLQEGPNGEVIAEPKRNRHGEHGAAKIVQRRLARRFQEDAQRFRNRFE